MAARSQGFHEMIIPVTASAVKAARAWCEVDDAHTLKKRRLALSGILWCRKARIEAGRAGFRAANCQLDRETISP
jgi:hypothetical protein